MNSVLRWERDFAKTVFRLALPVFLQALVVASMHIINNVMIGFLGEAQLAGVTQANRVTFLLQVAQFGLTSGASIFTAQYWGKRDIEGIRRTMSIGLVNAVALATLVAIPCLVAPELVMRLLIKDAEAALYGAQYLRVVGVAYLVEAIVLTEEAVLRSTEQVLLPMIAGAVAIVTNTLLSYLLIFGKFGMPQLGVEGAAIATLSGMALMLTIILTVSYRKRLVNALRLRDLRRPSREEIKKYFKTVAPVMLNEMLWSSGVVMYSVAYGRMSAGAVAAMSIFYSIEQLAIVGLRGTNAACAILVGKAIGAGRPEEAQLIAKRMLFCAVSMCVLVGTLVIAFAGHIVSLFSVAPETAEAARQIVFLFGLTIWVNGCNGTMIVGIMRAGGDVVFSAAADVLFLWVVGVPLVFAFGPGAMWPIQFVYLLTRVEELLKMGLGFYRLRSKRWIHNLVNDVEVA